jgi:alkylation response protein AidB-like acyl-CoA dehydrogenase
MDFTVSEEQAALRELAADLLTRQATPERIAELETGEWFDTELWRALGTAGLLGIALPEEHGGGGLGFAELALVLEQVGAHVAPVPVWASIVCAALPIARFGTPEQCAQLLPGVIAGDTVLTAALVEPLNEEPRRPTAQATKDGDGWRLEGTKTGVPLVERAARVVVPASVDGHAALFLLDPTATGVTIESQTGTSLEPQGLLRLEGAPAEALGEVGAGDDALGWLLDRALTGLAAVQTGICERAVKMAAEYTSDREQFGRAVATFQAVGHRLADAYTDSLALRLATQQAVWRIAEGLPAADAVAVAKWWAAEAGHRVVHAAHHVHGGVGVDVTYPLHRYTRWAKQVELTLGGAAVQARVIGRRLASEPV